MAEIQAALPASFMKVANAQKTSAKEPAAADLQLATFFGVLKSQLAGQDVEIDSSTGKAKVAADPAALSDEVIARSPLDADLMSGETRGQVPAEAVLPVVAAAAQPQSVSGSAGASGDSGGEASLPLAMSQILSDATEAGQSLSDASEKSKGKAANPGRPEAAGKSGMAAIAAAQGQALPQADADGSVQPGAATASATKLESLVSTAATTAGPFRAEATPPAALISTAPTTSVTPANPFDQTLRQAESRIHAAIESPLRSPGFAAELGNKVIWLAGRQGQLAELSLNPPQLGALEVRVSISGGETTAQFFSANPAVREALDAAMPKLRELMAQAGIDLGEAEVREQAFGQRDQSGTQRQAGVSDEETLALPLAMVGSNRLSGGSGLVDLYI
jgi:flagellar hook-length control protein FliK